MRDSALF